MAGTNIAPHSAPKTAYVNQLHGAPVSLSAAHRVTAPTILLINTAIIPPPAKPTNVEKQPTPRYSHRVAGVCPRPWSGAADPRPPTLNTRPAFGRRARCRRPEAARNPPTRGRTAA